MIDELYYTVNNIKFLIEEYLDCCDIYIEGDKGTFTYYGSAESVGDSIYFINMKNKRIG